MKNLKETTETSHCSGMIYTTGNGCGDPAALDPMEIAEWDNLGEWDALDPDADDRREFAAALEALDPRVVMGEPEDYVVFRRIHADANGFYPESAFTETIIIWH